MEGCVFLTDDRGVFLKGGERGVFDRPRWGVFDRVFLIDDGGGGFWTGDGGKLA